MATKATSNAVPGTSRVPETITSRDNRWLKHFRAALSGDPPELPGAGDTSENEVAGVEGAKLVETALETAAHTPGLEIIAVLASDSGERHLARLSGLIPTGARLLRSSDRIFAQIAGTQSPQGIAALLRPRAATFDDLVSGVPLILVLAGLQDPGNVGVLVRTAEAFGATGVAACSAGGIGTANPFAPKALRASAGSALRLPILRGAAAPVLMAQLRVAGVRVVATCPDDTASPGKAKAPWEIDWSGATALLLGNEGAGLPADLIRSADQIARIPQADRSEGEPMDSLNASVAGAVLLYEAARQRN